ncbi:MAG: type 1 glutamine amidotransferase [Acidimicrobiia bacterium]|nr:type 1 glutamine amidotransferase [Acidimicrobiia bacterium]
MNVLVFTHGPLVTPGWLADALSEVEADHTMVDLSLGDPVPMGRWDRVVVLGGHMGAYEVDKHPWLVAEKQFLKEQLAIDTPVLGICLGSQLLADVIGGRAHRGDGEEVGFLDLERTAAGAADTTMAALDGTVVAWHQDTFELPQDAELLAFTGRYPHAFRHGSAMGVQSHPELTPEMWARWMAAEGTGDLEDAGLDPAAFAQRLADESDRLRTQAVAFFRSWLEE